MRFAVVLLTIVLSGCASHTTQPEATGASRPLLAPQTLGGDRAVNQIVRGALGEREMTMSCVVTIKGNTMTIVGLSAVGVRLFTIKYDGVHTTVDNTLPIPPQLTPERLLADLQLVYWPLTPLAATLQAGGWAVTEASGTRRLRSGDRLVAEVHYANADPWSGRSWLVNLEHGYTLSIDSRAM